MTPDALTMIARLGAAIGAGAVLGINRDLHHKAAGVRTHALVAVGGALIVIVIARATAGDAQALSRVIQGLLTGIGFLGAGVIIHRETGKRVQGLTTAASIWVASILGVACGTGQLVLTGIAICAVLTVLVLGGPLERALERSFDRDDPKQRADEVDRP